MIYKMAKTWNPIDKLFFEDNDEFKTPMIDFNVKREYDELSNKIFTSKEGKEYVIDTAIQTISFFLF